MLNTSLLLRAIPSFDLGRRWAHRSQDRRGGIEAPIHLSATNATGTMGATEAPSQQQPAVLALIGILTFMVIIGAVLFYRNKTSAQSEKTEETQVTLNTHYVYSYRVLRLLPCPCCACSEKTRLDSKFKLKGVQ